MPLSAGSRLGPYQILTPIGFGGMGEVYRARDSRLARDVALKVLPTDLAGDAARRARFEQEARAAGALNHLGIVTVYDIGSQEGLLYIVSELIDGSTLRAAMDSSVLPQRKAIDYAAQIADALAAAHAAGIVHRDLKPENIMLTPEERTKILDFGLARQTGKVKDTDVTRTVFNTDPGTVMGTVAYMSPEQVRGQDAGHRADLFSLGLILHEMLSGARTFQRGTGVETMNAILKEDPPEVPAAVTPPIAQIVRRCLEKEPRLRFQSAQDLAFAARNSSGSTVTAGVTPIAPARRGVPWRAIGAAVVCLALGWLLARPSHPGLAELRFAPIAAEEAEEFYPAWSPDARSIAYVRRVGNRNQLFVRSLDSPATVQLTSFERGISGRPVWTPDGSRICFLRQDGVWSVGRAGGEAALLLASKDRIGAFNLSPDGKALALWMAVVTPQSTTTSLWISSPPGSAPRPYGAGNISIPSSNAGTGIGWSPDGKWILLHAERRNAPAARVLLPWPEDGRSPRQIGEAISLTDGLFSWFPDSRHVAFVRDSSQHLSGIWIGDTASGAAWPLLTGPVRQREPAVSPDGARMAYAVGGNNPDIIEIPFDGSPARNLVATTRIEGDPFWSPSGEEFAYVTDVSGAEEIWIRDRKGHARPVATQKDFTNFRGPVNFHSPHFSPDGTRLAYVSETSIWVSPVAGGTPFRVFQGRVAGFGVSWSPDGKWIVSRNRTETGKEVLLKIRASGQGAPEPIADGASENAAWSPSGQWIFDTNDGIRIVSPDGKQTRSFGTGYEASGGWSPDGALLYLVRRDGGRRELGALDWKISRFRPIVELPPELRLGGVRGTAAFSVAPDGKSLITGVTRAEYDIWIVEGFPKPRSGWRRYWPLGR
jgi:Tol biopolymer transport system component